MSRDDPARLDEIQMCDVTIRGERFLFMSERFRKFIKFIEPGPLNQDRNALRGRG